MNYFSYRISLFKLSSRRCKIDKLYKKQYEEAKKDKDEEKKEEVASLASYELGGIEDEILYLEHCYLTSIATKLLLPVPPFANEEKGGLWTRSQHTGKYHLTTEGIIKLRGDIRKEKKGKNGIICKVDSDNYRISRRNYRISGCTKKLDY